MLPIKQTALTGLSAQSRNLALDWLKNPVSSKGPVLIRWIRFNLPSKSHSEPSYSYMSSPCLPCLASAVPWSVLPQEENGISDPFFSVIHRWTIACSSDASLRHPLSGPAGPTASSYFCQGSWFVFSICAPWHKIHPIYVPPCPYDRDLGLRGISPVNCQKCPANFGVGGDNVTPVASSPYWCNAKGTLSSWRCWGQYLL